jgi:CSLREA domain-containing protein
MAASASTYTVDSTADLVDEAVGSEGCQTAVGTCTLRAAIEESNDSAGIQDTIVFAGSFDGWQTDTIALGSGLPAITDSVHIDGDSGGQCKTQAGPAGPCAGVSGPIAGSALVVEGADGVEIEGLSISDVGGTAIEVIDASEGFEARDNWIGVKLDGNAGTNNKGVFLGPGSDNAMIGGSDAADRNVIAGSHLEGLDIEGASSSRVQGNYFGVQPKGSGYIEGNWKNIEVTDSTAGGGFKAEDTEIGTTIKGTALATAACDGGCNVISRATLAGVDLNGESGVDEAPASGPTTVHGNYLGMDSKGTAGVGAGHYAIHVGAASDATIGGPRNGDPNFVTNCPYGIYQEGGDGFEARNNWIGLDITGSPADFSAAFEAGVSVSSFGLSKPPLVLENTVRMANTGVGVSVPFGGAEIVANMIQGGDNGIATGSSPEPAEGSLIEGNLIEESWDGIWISDGDNDVLGNSIFNSRDIGIFVVNWAPFWKATGNVIGGDLPVEENTISGTEGPAIKIIEELETGEGGENEVGRNNGAFNGARFIDLRGSANGEIQPPSFGVVTELGASGGGAEAGAKIRVFRKASAETGELESFLAETSADAGGDWEVTYPAPVPKGTIVAATQTSVAGGTSELVIATVPNPKVIVDPVGEVDNGEVITGCLFAGDCGGPAGPGDSRPNQTKIFAGPKAQAHATTVTFRFSSSRLHSSFECKLDSKPFEVCKSPKTYRRVPTGRHVFKVRAVDAGMADPTPAGKRFRILE